MMITQWYDQIHRRGTLAEGSLFPRRQTADAGDSATLSQYGREARLDLPESGGYLSILYNEDEPDWLWGTLANLGPLFELEENWDSYQSEPIAPRAAVFGLNYLFSILSLDSPPPIVVPTSSSGVQFEWHQSGIDVEITTEPSGHIELGYRDEATGDEWFVEDEELWRNLDRIRQIVTAL